MRSATFRFYAELNDFLPPADRQREVVRSFIDTPTVKDQAEAGGDRRGGPREAVTASLPGQADCDRLAA
jgi:hypothetical protein